MNSPTRSEIKKLHVKETVQFAINCIPGVDRKTLEMLLELINVDGTHGAISHLRLLSKMRLVLKHVPGACPRSMMILADLLEIPRRDLQATLQAPDAAALMPAISVAQLLQATVHDDVFGGGA